MKKTLLSVLSLAAVFAANAQLTPSVFKGSGSTGNGEVIYSIAADESHNVYGTGILTGTLTDGAITVNNAGGNDIYFAKYNSNGQMIWAKSIGSSGSDMGLSISYNKGFVFVSGVFNGTVQFGTQTLTSQGQDDGFLAKYDSSGNFVWVKQFGSTWLDRVDKVMFTTNDNMYVTASLGDGTQYGGNTLTSAGGIDGYVFKLDSSGNLLDYINIGGSSNEYAGGLCIKNGSMYLTGLYFSNTLSAGALDIDKVGQYDGFVLRMSETFDPIWLRSFGGSDYDGGSRTLVDDNGNCYVAGYSTGSIAFDNVSLPGTFGVSDGVIAKYDSLGNVMWAKRAGTNSFCHYRDLRFGASQNEIQPWGHFKGDIVIGGQTYSSASASEQDFFSATYSPSGAVTEVKTYGGTNEESIVELVNTGNALWLCGSFNTSTTFAGSTYTSAGASDMGLWKFTLPTTGMKDADGLTGGMINVFPNPSTGSIVLQSDKKMNQVAVFDQLGKMVYHEELINTEKTSFELNVPAGIYIIKADTEAGTLTQKLIIKQ